MKDIPLEKIKEVLIYEWESGLLYWNGNHPRAGLLAGSKNGKGYFHISFKGKFYPSHRVAWALFFGENPEQEIDHINGNREDNRIENLRLATKSQNRMNMKARGNWPKGVYLNKRGKFQSQIKIEGKNTYLGIFDNPEEAHQAYVKKAKEIFGEFACLTR